MTWVQTRALAKVNTDEVLAIKQMCSPSIQISFPHVDLDYKAWNLTELRSCWDIQWLIIQYEPGVPFNGQNRSIPRKDTSQTTLQMTKWTIRTKSLLLEGV